MVSLFVHRGLWSLDKEKLDIPVMYDDQHGRLNISSVVFLNALELTEEGYIGMVRLAIVHTQDQLHT